MNCFIRDFCDSSVCFFSLWIMWGYWSVHFQIYLSVWRGVHSYDCAASPRTDIEQWCHHLTWKFDRRIMVSHIFPFLFSLPLLKCKYIIIKLASELCIVFPHLSHDTGLLPLLSSSRTFWHGSNEGSSWISNRMEDKDLFKELWWNALVHFLASFAHSKVWTRTVLAEWTQESCWELAMWVSFNLWDIWLGKLHLLYTGHGCYCWEVVMGHSLWLVVIHTRSQLHDLTCL